MTEYDNSNRGALFKNKKDPAHPNSANWPDYKGSLNVAGIDYWLSAWIKKDKNGATYMSLSVKPKEDKPVDAPAAAPKAAVAAKPDPLDDDIPFVWAYTIPLAGLLSGVMYAKDMLQMWA